MIACDACQEWFHGDCVGVSAGQQAPFRCPRCSGRGSGKGVADRPSSQVSGSNLSTRPRRQLKRRRIFDDDSPPRRAIAAKLRLQQKQHHPRKAPPSPPPPPPPPPQPPPLIVDAGDIHDDSEGGSTCERMLLPAEDESATDDEMETAGGFQPPQVEEDSDPEAADRDRANLLLDEDDFASTSVFRFPKRCGFCDSCRLRADCGRCEICQAKKRYPNLRLEKVVCVARQCRTVARLGGPAAAAGTAPFIIQKRGRGRPSKASLNNPNLIFLSGGGGAARQRRREDAVAFGTAAKDSQRQPSNQHHYQPHLDGLLVHTSDAAAVVASVPQFCTPYGLAYSDHSYCKHHSGTSWQSCDSPLPVSRLASSSLSPNTSGGLASQNHQLHPHHQHQAYYTLNEDTDNLRVTWPEEPAA